MVCRAYQGSWCHPIQVRRDADPTVQSRRAVTKYVKSTNNAFDGESGRIANSNLALVAKEMALSRAYCRASVRENQSVRRSRESDELFCNESFCKELMSRDFSVEFN